MYSNEIIPPTNIPCRDPNFFFTLHVIKLTDCGAKVCPEYRMDPYTGKPIHGLCGRVYFDPGSFTSGIIAHESLHMAFAYLDMLEILMDEEIIADNVGHFASNIADVFWENKDILGGY